MNNQLIINKLNQIQSSIQSLKNKYKNDFHNTCLNSNDLLINDFNNLNRNNLFYSNKRSDYSDNLMILDKLEKISILLDDISNDKPDFKKF